MDVDTLASGVVPLISTKNHNSITTENIPMECGSLERLIEGGNNDLRKEIFDIQSSNGCISLGKEVIEPSALHSSEVCNRAQFWGAVGIFIEKPHILNRRLCGVTDLWWGKLNLSQTDKVGLDATVSQTMTSQALASETVDDTPKSLATVDSSNKFVINTLDNLDNLVLMAWKLLQGSEGKCEGVCDDDDPQKTNKLNVDREEYKASGRTSENEEKILDDLKNLLRNSAFEDIPIIEGRRFEPWPALTGGSDAVFAVVRRNLPKQPLRFSSPLELVMLDGRHGRCSVASGMTLPPLLPYRPYHLQHQLEDGRLTMVCLGGNRDPNHPYGSAVPTSDGVTTPAGSEVSTADNEVSPADNEVSPADNEVSPADNEVSSADNEVSSADNEVSPVDNEVSPADNEVSPANSRWAPSHSSGVMWLQDVVLPRVARWATQVSEEGATGSNGSLTNVDLQAYSALYTSLKSKYAEKIIKSWTERTDPHKFVHEDIGIATYLLLLWSKLPRPQRFLDLGCGNGLLVYILASEGHKGQGLDIRKRAIWDTFPPFVDLKEHVVRPHDGCLPSEADWLLGNHSDELTPWIPVMAARASPTCNFFVLPCCPHDFTAKFLRRNSSMSQYTDYLHYVQEVGEQCGFVMERDRLKIPSTKRVCFVGRTRNHAPDARPTVLLRLQQYIDKRVAHYINNQPARKEEEVAGTNGVASHQSLNQNGNSYSGSDARSFDGGKLWSAGFVARGREQRTRNCTQLHQDVKDDLVGAVVRVVLGSESLEACSPWQAGPATPLREVAEALGPRRLQQLKKECGGLQTLLRNHRHIFAVQRGTVTLRSPGKVPEDLKRHRPCWFFVHHPQGCPNTASSCIYGHAPHGEAVVGPVPAKVHTEMHV